MKVGLSLATFWLLSAANCTSLQVLSNLLRNFAVLKSFHDESHIEIILH